MPLRKVQFYPGEFYHIFNRGNARQEIFFSDKDRYRFLQAMYLSNNVNQFTGVFDLERNKSGHTLVELKELLEQNHIGYDPLVRICTDCLMPNHFHFILEELKNGGISLFMQRLGTSYGKYFTIKYDRPGSLFQGRFKAVHISNDDQLKYLLAYINVINPAQLIEPELKEAGIKDFNKIWQWVNNYNWGAHQEYMDKRNSIIIDKGLLGKIFPTVESYQKFMKGVLRGKEINMWEFIEELTID